MHHSTRRLRLVALAACIVFAATPRALADQIDGDWCRDALSLSIDGPSIRLPSGKTIIGTYDRHGFSYQVPEDEANAGWTIMMRQQNEETMLLGRIPNGTTELAGEPEIWNRCSPIS